MSSNKRNSDLAALPLDIRTVARRDFLFAGAAAGAGTILPASAVLAEAPMHAAKLAQKVTDQDREHMGRR